MQIRFVGINSHAGCPRLLHAAANTDNVTLNLQQLCQHHSTCRPLSLTTHIFPTLPSFLSPSLQSSLGNSAGADWGLWWSEWCCVLLGGVSHLRSHLQYGVASPSDKTNKTEDDHQGKSGEYQ